MAGSKVLVVEDDQVLLSVLKYNLTKEGHAVVTASDGARALELARTERPELVILDIMLPRVDGLEVCRILRTEMTVPILMLTARSEEIDKVVGLEIGADDYVTKPFGMREFLARVRAMLRRTQMVKEEARLPKDKTASSLKVGGLEIDIPCHQALLNGSALDLSPKEFDLLVFFVRNRGIVFSRDQLLEKVWGYDYAGGTRTVDVHVRWLRQQIETDPAHPRHISTVRGVGYRFES